MSEDWSAACQDTYGDVITFQLADDDQDAIVITFIVGGEDGKHDGAWADMKLGPEQREEFVRLFMEAGRAAEAHAAQAGDGGG